MTILFSNPGEIDPRQITTHGINVKDSPSAIGYFGTGFKYAIAVLMREKQKLEIFSGETVFTFEPQRDTIRGKEFDFIIMKSSSGPNITLGFTTELGKNWTLENAYRELWSNMMDEQGSFLIEHPGKGFTTVKVTGEEFTKVHQDRESFLFYPSKHTLLWSDPKGRADIYLGENKKIFYRGIAVCDLQKRSRFTYNILCPTRLTEDRTVSSSSLAYILRDVYIDCASPDLLTESLTVDSETYFEAAIDYDWFSVQATPGFTTAAINMIKEKPLKVNKTVEAMYYKGKLGKLTSYTERKLSEQEEQQMKEALDFCQRIGFNVSQFPIKHSENLGENILALALHEQKEIWIATRCFHSYQLREALIEEFLHLTTGARDYSREMQNLLFAHIVILGERLLNPHGIPTPQQAVIIRETMTAIRNLDEEVPF